MKFIYIDLNNNAVEKAYDRVYALFHVQKIKIKTYKDLDLSLDMDDDQTYVCANIWHVIYLKVRSIIKNKKVRIIFWVQGAVAHESYLKHNSKFKFIILNSIEKLALKLSDSYIYVSSYMAEFYSGVINSKYKKSVIIPCISDLNLNKNIVRDINNYCYIGGMSKWQNFDKIIKIMNHVIHKNPSAKFSIATNDIQVCEKLLNIHASLALKSVTSVVSLKSKKEIEDFLSAAAFGFLIRDDIVVNNVASPIKLAEYFSCGVNVISTKGLTSYQHLISQAGYILDADNLESINNIDFKFNEKEALDIYLKNFSMASVETNVQKFCQDIGVL